MRKLIDMRIALKIVELMSFTLNESRARVVVGRKKSHVLKITSGVKREDG